MGCGSVELDGRWSSSDRLIILIFCNGVSGVLSFSQTQPHHLGRYPLQDLRCWLR
jgi:hypothetical protein